MKIISPAFKDGGTIPEKYTCEGENVNPPLEFVDVPKKALSCVLIMDDPDVPPSVRKDQMFVHWVIYDIPPTATKIAEGTHPPGVIGVNTKGQLGYFGPCPPDREHRYFFKLYALDTILGIEPGASKEKIEKLIAPHILERAELIGLYCKIENR